MIAAICMPPSMVESEDGTRRSRSRAQRLSFLVPLCLILVGFSTALVCILYDPGIPEKAVVSRTPTSSSNNWLIHRATQQSRYQDTARHRLIYIILRTIYLLWFNPVIAFLIQILLALLSTVLVLSQKFSAPKNPKLFCGLQDSRENAWGFGQTLSIVMLLLPALSACQTYLEGRQAIQQGATRTKD